LTAILYLEAQKLIWLRVKVFDGFEKVIDIRPRTHWRNVAA
jgi:hypothetical protein